jgi:hypothetical protein
MERTSGADSMYAIAIEKYQRIHGLEDRRTLDMMNDYMANTGASRTRDGMALSRWFAGREYPTGPLRFNR